MNELNDHEFEVPANLKERYDIKRIAKQGATILVQLDGKAVRFDVESKIKNTLANFERQAKVLGITDGELKEEIMLFISEQWLKLLENGNGKGDTGSTNDADDDNETTAQKALGLAEEQCSELFLDQFGTPYTAIQIDEHTETLALKSSRFKNWLCRIYYNSEEDVLNSETVTNILNILKAKAEFEGTANNLSLRVASVKEEPFTIYYDLTNKDWQAVKITPEAWNIEHAPVMFTRYKAQQPQVYPSKEYSPDVFDSFMKLVNVKGEENKLLLKCYIVSLFYPDIPKPVLMLYGEQNSAKSTLQELIRVLVDPSSILTLAFPRDINELVQKLSHNYVAYFDNISDIPEWISDQLCRAVTGSGFSKRELYTDDDDVIYNFKRCIGFNGINLGATKADLLDRGLIIELERIAKQNQRKIKDIWSEFELIKPQLLGYIFDILVQVLEFKSNGCIELQTLPRMADFAEIGEIISRCMGNPKDGFIDAYYRNIELQTEEAIAANLVGNAIVQFMQDKEEWIGSATELHMDLEANAATLNINIHDKSWPKSSNSISRKLNQIKTNLREIGVQVEKAYLGANKKSRGIKIRKISSEPSEPTVASDIDPNQARINVDISDDTDDTDDTLHTLQGQSVDEGEQQQVPDSVYRAYADTWKCHDCGLKGDKWFMIKHIEYCSHNKDLDVA